MREKLNNERAKKLALALPGAHIERPLGEAKTMKTHPLIKIGNNGKDIAETNYWEMPFEDVPVVVSVNAGAIRLLLPRIYNGHLDDYRSCDHVVMTYGPWLHHSMAVEFMFEDFTDTPYSFHLSVDSFVNGVPSEPQDGEYWDFSIWAKPENEMIKVIERTCYTNKGFHRLPHLKEYKGKKL